jgi:hypothetical protein
LCTFGWLAHSRNSKPRLFTEDTQFIKQIMPWAHGHQIKAISKLVLAIIDKQTGCQAELARTQGNQEAAAKQLSRLIHNPRLKPKDFARWLCLQVLATQVPRRGKLRLTIDWTTEDDQHLLVISLVVGRRAIANVVCAISEPKRSARR